MALRTTIVKCAAGNTGCTLGGLRRWVHAAAISPPLDGAIAPAIPSQPSVLPEFDWSSDQNQNHIGLGFPGFSSVGSMELMAVPKRKVSRHKRGIRNGPRALKPVPVIIRCRSCGRVKLPHFYCCSGERGNAGERDNSTS